MAPQKPAIFTLSRKRRRVYFRLLLAVFIIIVPVLFLYATGYRFERIAGLTKTGGMYVTAEQLDAEIYLDNELVHETGTFSRAFYIQDLVAGTYTVEVTKAGYHPWGKTLPVYEHLVTEAVAFNMPKEPVLVLIPSTFTNQTTNATSTATSTQTRSNPMYEEIRAAFATTSPDAEIAAPGGIREQDSRDNGVEGTGIGLSTTGNFGSGTAKIFRGMQLADEGAHIAARWMRALDSIPFYFCIREEDCVQKIILNTKGEKPSYFDFFPGSSDLTIVTLHDGVYVTELDNRSGQNIQPLFLAPNADFRIIGGSIYVKTDDDAIYKVEI